MRTSGQTSPSIGWLLGTVLFASNSSPLMANGAKLNSTSWSVMNVKLGDTANVAESKINSALKRLSAKTLAGESKLTQATHTRTLGRFTSTPIRFGSIFIGKYGPEHKSSISLSMSYQFPGGKVFAIRRTASSMDPAPTLEAVQESLHKKYGDPQGINMSAAHTIVYTWVVGNRVPLQTNPPAVMDDDSGGYDGTIHNPYDISNFKEETPSTCSKSIIAALTWYRRNSKQLSPSSNKNCGTFLQVRISTTAEKVNAIDTFLIDNAAWDKTNLSFSNYIHNHTVAMQHANEKQHGNANNPDM